MASSAAAVESEACRLAVPGLILPSGFTMVNTDGAGDCFFHARAKGLSVMLAETYTTAGVRRLCADYMLELHRRHGFGPEIWIYTTYLARIKSSKKGQVREALMKEACNQYNRKQAKISCSAADLKVHGREPNATWGEQQIDGKIICIKINQDLMKKGSPVKIKIHTFEASGVAVTHHLIDNESEYPVAEDKDIASIYQDPSIIIHVVCHNSHWQAILRTVHAHISHQSTLPSSGVKDLQIRDNPFEEQLSDLLNFLDDNIAQELRELIKLFTLSIQRFDQYKIVMLALDRIKKLFENIECKVEEIKQGMKTSGVLATELSKIEEKYEKLQKLYDIVRLKFCNQTGIFCQYLLEDQTRLKALFFCDIIDDITEERVGRLFRDISIHLHPDRKIHMPNKSLVTEVFQLYVE